MFRIGIVLFFLVHSICSYAQPCDISKELTEMQILYDQGNFDAVIQIKNGLNACISVPDGQFEILHTISYKSLRNIRKGKSALKTLEKLKDRKLADDDSLGRELEFLLAEAYALRGNIPEHLLYINKIEEDVMSNPNASHFEKGRFYLVKYYGFEKEENYGDAFSLAQKALSHFDKMETPPIYYKGNALRALGNMNRNRADYDKSAAYYLQELALYEAHFQPDHFDIAVCNFNLGSAYYYKLEYQQALDHYLTAHKTWIKVYNPEDQYMKMLNEAIGDMYWELNEPENALHFFDESAIGDQKINNDLSENTLHTADSILQSGNYANAIDYYNEAYQWRQKTFGKGHSLTAACKNFVARAVRSSGNTTEALLTYQEAISILVDGVSAEDIYSNPSSTMEIKSHQYLLESLIAKGELLAELYQKTNNFNDLQAAFETHEVGIDILQQLKKRHMSEDSKVFWTQHTLSLMERSIETAYQLHLKTGEASYLEKAFSFSERSKALLLLASIDERKNIQFSDVSEEILGKEAALKKEITQYNGKLENEEKRCAQVREKMLKLYQDKLGILQNEYDLVLNQIQADYPDYYDLKYETNIVSIPEIRSQLLDANTELVSYFMGEKQGYVFFITENDFQLRKIPDSEKLQVSIKSFFNLLNANSEALRNPNQSYHDFTSQSAALYKKLLEPELARSRAKELIIIPDGLLSYIPFDVLLTNSVTTTKRNYRDLPYLLKQYALSYSPSASIKVRTASPSNSAYNYVGFAPQYNGVNYSEDREQLKNLEYNKEEVGYATTLFKGNSWSGLQASETILKEKATHAGILHLAMHGQVEDNHPLLSKLYFSPSTDEDGILHTYEVYNMHIPSQLVILSACNTASGKLERGEGILSLERAFQYAGSQSLVSTLWTVDDKASSVLIQNFLKNIDAGQTKNLALQDAKLSFLQTASADKLHPFYWSSFKLTGNTDALSQKYNSNYIWFGLGGLGVLGLFYYFRRKKTA